MVRRAFLRDRRGASAVEFALVAGPLVLLVFGSIEFGRLLWAQQGVAETARETARCVGVMQASCTADGTVSVANARSFADAAAQGWGLALADDAISVDPAASCNGLSGFSRVSIRYDFTSPFPGFSAILGDAATITAEACFPNQA